MDQKLALVVATFTPDTERGVSLEALLQKVGSGTWQRKNGKLRVVVPLGGSGDVVRDLEGLGFTNVTVTLCSGSGNLG